MHFQLIISIQFTLSKVIIATAKSESSKILFHCHKVGFRWPIKRNSSNYLHNIYVFGTSLSKIQVTTGCGTQIETLIVLWESQFGCHAQYKNYLLTLKLLAIYPWYGKYIDMILLDTRSVFNLETIPIFYPHYHTHSGNTSRPVNLAPGCCALAG